MIKFITHENGIAVKMLGKTGFIAHLYKQRIDKVTKKQLSKAFDIIKAVPNAYVLDLFVERHFFNMSDILKAGMIERLNRCDLEMLDHGYGGRGAIMVTRVGLNEWSPRDPHFVLHYQLEEKKLLAFLRQFKIKNI